MALGWLKDALSDAVDSAWDAATEVADAAVDAVGSIAAGTGDVIGAVGDVVDTATLGAAGAILNAIDDTVLDTVDTLTGGLIDVDFDDGNLTADIGIDGVANLGASIGEDGIRQGVDLVNQSYDVGLTDRGLDASGSAGIDWGPLPYAGGDLAIGADGDVAFEGKVQGTIPTPVGLLSGQAEAEFQREGDNWAGSLDAEGTLYLENGSVVRGGLDAAYVSTDDGSALSVGLEGSFSSPGVGTVGGAVGYDRIEQGGVVAEKFDADGYASGFGLHVDAGVSHTSITTPDGTVSDWDLTGDLAGLDSPDGPAVAQNAMTAEVTPSTGTAGTDSWSDSSPSASAAEPEPAPRFEQAIAAADTVEASVDDMFSDLG